MGFDEKLHNMSQRVVGKAEEVAGRVTHNQRWEQEGRARVSAADEQEAREKAKDLAKAQEATGHISRDERLRLERHDGV
ncbi:CsbD family protein [Catellatospora sp. NPDC049609]|uniref:CsbD family protein n=1 Tax=Catellatospora sp. NPDC049609 TaxID=3155505 RepID=UPI003431DA79